jgi:aminoglycoside phosphotransferase (APT) family kinase protein
MGRSLSHLRRAAAVDPATPLVSSDLPDTVRASLVGLGLLPADQPVTAERLTGGVSSDIWKVTAGGRVFCVKRAMARLAVKDEWLAPVERNRYERLWYETASARVPGIAPRIIAADDAAMLFAMEYLDPADHRLWKSELLAARVDVAFAAEVGGKLASIHSGTAGDATIAALFPTGHIFEALRLDPYLRATGRRYPALRARLDGLADRTASTALALVHGDVSPKNILVGPAGPVFLDAECAWYGDPAFDLAFCLNHLLLKCLPQPRVGPAYLAAFDALAAAYFGAATVEQRPPLEARAASLLPGLFLARIDGKSPVEYVTDERDRERVRHVAIPLIATPPSALAEVRDAWSRELAR